MEESVVEIVAVLAIQLGIILVAAKVGGELAVRFLKLPSVLGELVVGIIISPFALGGLHFDIGTFTLGPLFELPHGDGTIPVELSIYFVAQIAAVILLFEAGLETNRAQFIRYFRPATVVALGGVFFPFVMGAGATLLFGFASFSSVDALIPALFVGVAMTATSVGITARLLADIGQMDSPEGVTVLAAAVVDDVLGIVLLSIVIALAQQGMVSALSIGGIFLSAIGFLLVVAIVGSLLSNYISKFILSLRSGGASLSLALMLAILAAGIAEHYFGLAMIIGAYAVGLALSATKLKERIEGQVHNVSLFLSPVFFVVIGMQVNFSTLFESEAGIILIVIFAVVLSLLGIISKLFGSGLPALGLGFNRLGAARIGTGMMPRGEVALIVAGIGLGAGVIEQEIFSVVVVMAVVTTIVAPPVLLRLFRTHKPGTVSPGSMQDENVNVGSS